MLRRVPRIARSRSAFTLVELLVAMAIFAILSIIAISAYRGLSDTDRLRNGTQLFQGACNKARSRAIHDKLARGVRLIASTDDPSLVDSFVMIGAQPNVEGVSLVAADFPDGSGNFNGRRLVLQIPAGTNLVSDAEYATFGTLKTAKALSNQAISSNGLRIQLGRNRRWYRMQSIDPADPDGFAIYLAEPYPNALTTGPTFGINYSLELGPTALAGAEPIPLPKDTVIDLDASQLPGAWRPNAGSTPNYSTQMDIMFTPGGSLQGTIVANGMLHFYFADRRDSLESPADPADLSFYPYYGTVADQYETRLVTLVTATAQTYAAEMNLTGGSRYDYAVNGKEAKQ